VLLPKAAFLHNIRLLAVKKTESFIFADELTTLEPISKSISRREERKVAGTIA
jgi:hypothetical protein